RHTPQGAGAWHQATSGSGRWWLVLRRKRASSAMDAVSGATERPCPHRIRVVTHENEDIYGRSTQNAKLFQSAISPKAAVNPCYLSNHRNAGLRGIVFEPIAWKMVHFRAVQAGLYGSTATIYKC